jgi:hypothetical protein
MSLPGTARETLIEESLLPEAWTQNGQRLLLRTLFFDNNELVLLDLRSKQRTTILSHPGWDLHSGRLSPDESWIVFDATTSPAKRQIFATPFHGAEAVSRDAWIPVTDGRSLDGEPRWSPDGELVYFLSDRDGFRCVWAQAVDVAGRTAKGAPFAVYHAHRARFTLDLGTGTGPSGLTIVPGKMIVTMAENTGNIWLAEFR